MIQRKQSLYLLAASIVAFGALGFGNLWKSDGIWVDVIQDTGAMIAFLISGLLSLFAVFLFKNRKLQMSLDKLNIVLNILLIAYLIYGLTNLPGGFSDSEKGIGLLLPFLSIILLFIANRHIKKDEELVKSVDRFR